MGTIKLSESAPNEPKVKRSESNEDDYCRPTIDTATRKVNFHSNIMPHKVTLCKHVTLRPRRLVWVKEMTTISNLICTGPKHFLWKECRVPSVHLIHEVLNNKSWELLLFSSSTFKNHAPKGIVLTYAKKSPVMHLAITVLVMARCTTVTGICASRNKNSGGSHGHNHTAATTWYLWFEHCCFRLGDSNFYAYIFRVASVVTLYDHACPCSTVTGPSDWQPQKRAQSAAKLTIACEPFPGRRYVTAKRDYIKSISA